MRINSDSNLNITYPNEFIVELDITEPSSNPNGWTSAIHCSGTGFVGERTISYWYNDNDGTYTTNYNTSIKTGTVKFVVENGTSTVYYNDNLMKTANEKVSVKFYVHKPPYNTNHLRIKNLKIKKL